MSSLTRLLDDLYRTMEPIAARYVGSAIRDARASRAQLIDALKSLRGLEAIELIADCEEDDRVALKALVEDLDLPQDVLERLLADDESPAPVAPASVVDARARQLTRNLVNPWSRWVAEQAHGSGEEVVVQLDSFLRPWDPEGRRRFEDDWAELAVIYAGTTAGIRETMAEFGRQLLRNRRFVELPGDAVLFDLRAGPRERPLFLAATKENWRRILAQTAKWQSRHSIAAMARLASANWLHAAVSRVRAAGQPISLGPEVTDALASRRPEAASGLLGTVHFAVCQHVTINQEAEEVFPNVRVAPATDMTAGDGFCRVELKGDVTIDHAAFSPLMAEDLEQRFQYFVERSSEKNQLA